jgi:hypothetical protein
MFQLQPVGKKAHVRFIPRQRVGDIIEGVPEPDPSRSLPSVYGNFN